MWSRTGAEDEKKAVVMPSFDPQLPISNAMYSSSSITFYIHVFNWTFHSLFHPSSWISLCLFCLLLFLSIYTRTHTCITISRFKNLNAFLGVLYSHHKSFLVGQYQSVNIVSKVGRPEYNNNQEFLCLIDSFKGWHWMILNVLSGYWECDVICLFS